MSAVVRRLAGIGSISTKTLFYLADREAHAVTTSMGGRFPLASQGVRYVVRGWVAAARYLPGGIREIIRLFLPGEPIETAFEERLPYEDLFAGSHASVLHLTHMTAYPELAALLQAEQREAMRLLAAHVARLSRMDSIQRCSHALLDIDARLRLVAAEERCGWPFAITQIHLGDYLGLSPVHVNRTVRRMREQGLATLKPKLEIHDRHQMQKLCGWSAIDEPWGTFRPGSPGTASLVQAG